MFPAEPNRRTAIRSRLPARRGFTVLELAVVMFVTVLVGGLSLGRIHDIMNQQRVYRASAVIRTNVEAAFALAARNRRPIRMSWDASKSQFNVTDRAGTTVFRHVSLGLDPYGLPSGAVAFSETPIEVFSNGLASDTLVITLSANGTTRTIRVSRAGLVQSQ
ncbi:MAG TPA: hypothetical protein VN706_20455 [Gemmatimonadaceae bacterium]|nr:hypothetical protein [Gemmatimonadaceae bacterium]